MKLNYTVKENKYSTIKEVLKDYFCISDRLLTKLKKANQIYLNNVSIPINHPIKLNDLIEVNLDFEENYENITPKEMNLDIIFEDEAFLIINKSPNTPVHPSILHFEDSLSNGVKFYFDKISLENQRLFIDIICNNMVSSEKLPDNLKIIINSNTSCELIPEIREVIQYFEV